MEQEEIKDEAARRNRLAIKTEKKNEKRQEYLDKMAAASTLEKLFIYLRYKWAALLLLQFALVFTGCLLGVVGKIIWEIWKMIFSVNL